MTPRRMAEPPNADWIYKIITPAMAMIIAFFLMTLHDEVKDHGKQLEEIKVDVGSLKTDVSNVKENLHNLIMTDNEKENRYQRERDEEFMKKNNTGN